MFAEDSPNIHSQLECFGNNSRCVAKTRGYREERRRHHHNTADPDKHLNDPWNAKGCCSLLIFFRHLSYPRMIIDNDIYRGFQSCTLQTCPPLLQSKLQHVADITRCESD